jgi:hypothetical protein
MAVVLLYGKKAIATAETRQQQIPFGDDNREGKCEMRGVSIALLTVRL